MIQRAAAVSTHEEEETADGKDAVARQLDPSLGP